jgi:hypothetical protein
MKEALTLWREPDGTLHAPDAIEGDRTLCGIAEEGDGESDDQQLIEVTRGRITCWSCVAIIRACKKIPAAKLNPRLRIQSDQ